MTAALDAALKHLAEVKARKPEWYVWVTEGQPPLTPEQYAEVSKRRSQKPKS